MRILVISDIHANWPALAAIDEPFDACLCLGDLADYGPDPLACVRWAMHHATYAIRGNHDHGVAQGIRVKDGGGYRYLTRVSRPAVWEALGLHERRYLLQLPVTHRLTLGGTRFLLVHATPRDPLDEYLLKDPETWARRVGNVDVDIVCVGHSHQPFHLQVNGRMVLNPGSVGLPRDGDPRAAYAIIHGSEVALKRVVYPIEETIARIQRLGWPRRAQVMMEHVLRFGRLPQAMSNPAAGAELKSRTTPGDDRDAEIQPRPH